MKPTSYPSRLRFLFQHFAEKTSNLVGSPLVFFFALLFIFLWILWGTFLGYSEKWHLFINSTTTVITLLMVFLIQNTQNRETKAVHLKLDMLLKKAGVHTSILDIEDLSDEERDALKEEFKKLYLKYSGNKKNNSKKD